MSKYWIHKSNGKEIKIPLKDIDQLMNGCKCSKFEAVDIWLTDHDYIVNQEQEELDKKAKNCGFRAQSDTKISKKAREIKVSATKKRLFESILANLNRCEDVSDENIHVLTKYRQISVKIGEKSFKITISEDRKPTK